MPTSSPYLLTPVIAMVGSLAPNSVLDVGCGYGQWGLLLRQHLDYPWAIEANRPLWRRRVEAIEAWDGYRNPLWELVYDRVIIGDARETLAGLGLQDFELALCIEVLEHLSPDDGDRLLDELRRVATHVVVTTPDHPLEQDEFESNPFEVHQSWWSWPALKRRGAIARLPVSGSTVALFSSSPRALRNWLRGRRLRVLGPLVQPAVRRRAQRALHRLGLHPGPPSSGGGPGLQHVR